MRVHGRTCRTYEQWQRDFCHGEYDYAIIQRGAGDDSRREGGAGAERSEGGNAKVRHDSELVSHRYILRLDVVRALRVGLAGGRTDHWTAKQEAANGEAEHHREHGSYEDPHFRWHELIGTWERQRRYEEGHREANASDEAKDGELPSSKCRSEASQAAF